MADSVSTEADHATSGAPLHKGSSELACPRCGKAMVRRQNRRDRSEFWGCPSYPRCRGTRPLEAIRTVRSDDPGEPIAHVVDWDDPGLHRAAAGASTRATSHRRRDRHRARIRERRPQIIATGAAIAVMGLVLAGSEPRWALAGWGLVMVGALRTMTVLFVDPPHVRAWAIGAAGEERLGASLETLKADGFVVLHDLWIGATKENIDHLLIGPPGIFIVEAKTYEGSVRVSRGELYLKGRRKTEFFDQVQRQQAAVATAIDVDSVSAFICVLDGDFPWFARPMARGIEVTPPNRLLRTVRGLPPILDDATVDRLGRLALTRLSRTLRRGSPRS